jgi:hypothetical protein
MMFLFNGTAEVGTLRFAHPTFLSFPAFGKFSVTKTPNR